MAVACPFGFPAVVETAPYLVDGTPFPTLFYLTCPSAVRAVTREEAAGGVEEFRRAVADDARLGRAYAALDALQRRRRRELASSTEPGGTVPPADGGTVLDRGIGGPCDAHRATCLHAYTATLLAAAAGVFGAAGASGGEVAAPVDEALGGSRGEVDQTPDGGWETLLGEVRRLWCRDARCAGLLPGHWEQHAAVDVGTNSVRCLVGLLGDTGTLLTLARRARITQLGAGLIPGGTLDSEARRRTKEAVVALVGEARALGARSITVVGTSAARDAADGPAFIAELGRDLGAAARVATGAEEAALTFHGATHGLRDDAVVLDIGGGSTELVRSAPVSEAAADPRYQTRSAEAFRSLEDVGGGTAAVPRASAATLDAVSLDVGCVRGTREWFSSDPPSVEERRAARSRCVNTFRPLARRFGPDPGSPGAPGVRLVGVAGTITTLACGALSLPEYDPEAIHARTFSRTDLDAVVDYLAAMGPDERTAVPCMQPGRAGVIVAGGEILLGAMEGLGWTEVRVSQRDLLDGVLLAAHEGPLSSV